MQHPLWKTTPVAIPPPQEILTLEEVLARAQEGRKRLFAAGLPTTRNVERRLAWKASRGIVTIVEERPCVGPRLTSGVSEHRESKAVSKIGLGDEQGYE